MQPMYRGIFVTLCSVIALVQTTNVAVDPQSVHSLNRIKHGSGGLEVGATIVQDRTDESRRMLVDDDDHDHDHDHEHGDDDDHDHDHDHDHEHHHHHDPAETRWHKVGAFFLMLGIGIFGCGAPYYLEHIGLTRKIMPFVNAFACGAFLGLSFFHLLPEALYVTDELKVGFDVGKSWYNLTFILAFTGFILIMIFEKVLLVGVASKEAVAVITHAHDDTESEKVAGSERTKACDLECAEKCNTTEAEQTVAFSPTALFASLSLSVHSIFEGLIVGMFGDVVTVWVATLSIAGHKWAAGFALAVNCINKRVTKSAALVYLSIFILSSPIGVIVGIFVSQGDSVVVAVINGISLGTILYTGCELLFEQFKGAGKMLTELLKFGFLILGAGVVLSLMMLHLAKGAHNHGHMHAH